MAKGGEEAFGQEYQNQGNWTEHSNCFKTTKKSVKICQEQQFQGGGTSPPPQNPGCFKCHGCHACQVITESTHFESTNTEKRYKIHQNLTCSSTYIVYVATCEKCKGQYVGKSTQMFKRRHSGHKQEVKKCYGGLGQHYGGQHGCGYSNLKIQIVDQVEVGDNEALAECELYWAHQLRAYVDNGGNAHSIKKEFGLG